MTWSTFLRWLLGASSVLAMLLYAFILLLDPYEVVPFAPSLARAPVSTNQRFSYPALARDASFDSAVIGTSTMRLLDPEYLDALTGARFVNLAMNSATAHFRIIPGREARAEHRHHRQRWHVVRARARRSPYLSRISRLDVR